MGQRETTTRGARGSARLALLVTLGVSLSVAAKPPAAKPPAAKPPPGPETVSWKQLPPDAFLCTRYGPDWSRTRGRYPDVIKGRSYDTPFTLTVPAGKPLRLTVKATSSVKGTAITYTASGLPADVAVPESGVIAWTPSGPADRRQELCFEATSASGAKAEPWCMTLVIAAPGLELLWSAGLGGKTWPDCAARPETQTLLEADLDGDGQKDALLSGSWSDPGDPMGHVYSRHDLVLRRPRPGKPDAAFQVDWPPGADDGAFMGDVSLAQTPDGDTLLVVKTHACDAREPVELFRVTPKGVRSVGDFSPDPSGDSELFRVTLERKDQAIVGVVVSDGDKTTRYTWRRGAYR